MSSLLKTACHWQLACQCGTGIPRQTLADEIVTIDVLGE